MWCRQLVAVSDYSVLCVFVLCLLTFATSAVAGDDSEQGTTFNGRRASSGRIIFKDNFEDQTNFKSNWQHTIKIADSPDYEFCVYSPDSENSYLRDDKLIIKPTLLPDNFVKTGMLKLTDCTGKAETRECELQAVAYMILPPVKTARLSTLGSFTFRYGIVEIIAKMPHGDWLIPELWLEPKENKYGPDYNSGRIIIAMARGNENLKLNTDDLGYRKVESGILMGTGENIKKQSVTRDDPTGWHSDFHNYTVVWTHDNLSFYVDGENKFSVVPFSGTRLSEYIGFNQIERKTWESGTYIAPFDTEFYISLGLSAGGVRVFPDNCVSGNRPKPWQNHEVKSTLKFWLDRSNWLPTWNGDDATLQIQRVKVTAI